MLLSISSNKQLCTPFLIVPSGSLFTPGSNSKYPSVLKAMCRFVPPQSTDQLSGHSMDGETEGQKKSDLPRGYLEAGQWQSWE